MVIRWIQSSFADGTITLREGVDGLERIGRVGRRLGEECQGQHEISD